jgi:murein DD-endopeptidase MepM/ murein hydrolase activator NlpD
LKRREKKSRFRVWLIALAVVGVVGAVVAGAMVFLEGSAPGIVFESPALYVGKTAPYNGTIHEQGRGLRRIWIGLLQGGKEVVLVDRTYPSPGLFARGTWEIPFEFTVTPSEHGLKDGEAILRIAAWDRSWRDWGKGNRAYLEQPVMVDTKPPTVEVISQQHNISQGGAGLVIYRVSEPGTVSGVMVGDNFFPGHPGYFKDRQIYLAFIALDHKQSTETTIFVKAVDTAGNSARGGLDYYLKKGRFRKDTIGLSNQFMRRKIPEFEQYLSGQTGTDLEKFLYINRVMREENGKTLAGLAEKTEAKLLWEGRFLRLPNSASKARFADNRTYVYNNKTVDRQYHFGVDLASLKRSPVPAANNGRVIFAGTTGIYGQMIALDHGFGLVSLYSHLSRIDVQVGDVLKKGATIGLTGMTGLAGGDHLHYGMMVHSVFVNPVEWWDASWITNNITARINAVAPKTN